MTKPNRLTAVLTHPLLWTAILFILLPYVAGANPMAGKWSGFVGIATTMVIFALFASGFNMLFGHVGELSFGHAMFFTIGAYTTALYSKGFSVQVFGHAFKHDTTNNLFIALAFSVVIARIVASSSPSSRKPRSSPSYGCGMFGQSVP